MKTCKECQIEFQPVPGAENATLCYRCTFRAMERYKKAVAGLADEKICTACGEPKDFSEFSPDACRKDGRTSVCKKCAALHQKAVRLAWTPEAKARAKAYKKQYDKDNADKINYQRRARRLKVREQLEKLERLETEQEARETTDYQQEQDEISNELSQEEIDELNEMSAEYDAEQITPEPKLPKEEKAKEKQDLADKTAKLIADFKMGSKSQ